MNDEIVSKPGSDIPFADEDAPSTDGASRLAASWITSRGLTNVEREDTCSRNVRSFTTFRASGLPAKRELPTPVDNKMLNHCRESLQQRYARQSSVQKEGKHEETESALQRYENAVLKYQKPKLRPKRQVSRERQQQNYSSSDESVARNKSKSTSSIDTQSVNNILDEYEDLDYRRSSDLSDIGSISVTNFEATMMDQQRRQQQQQQGRFRTSGTKLQVKSIPMKEKIQPVLKVNQQTQVRQRSRDRQKDSSKGHQHVASEETRLTSPMTTDVIENSRSKMPEVLLRKGEVQKRVDEWLNQAHSHNFPVPREKPLTRSNSSADQKSQRRYRQDSRSRSNDEARNRLNGGTSSSYDDLTRVDSRLERNRPEKVNVGVNTSRGTYKEYLAVKSRAKQQDYGFSAQSYVSTSRFGDSGPVSRIPQRGPLGSSFRSRRAEANPEEKSMAEDRVTNLTKARGESDYGRAAVSSLKMTEGSIATVTMLATSTTMTMTTMATTATSIIPCRRPSLKRSGNNDQNCSPAARLLVKEETDPRPPRAAGPSKGPLSAGSLGVQGEPISPNKDGESRRPAAAASGPMPRPAAAAIADKAVEVACKSTEVSTRCAANHPRDRLSKTASAESDRVALESPRRRSQVSSDVGRREPRAIDQSRQEQSNYGLAVGARVRALQGQVESRSARSKSHQIVGALMETKKPPVLPRKDLGVSPSRDSVSQDRPKVPTATPTSSFKPHNRTCTATSVLQQQLHEQNAARSRIAVCEVVPSSRSTRYASSDHVERIYERSLQPQVIHADDLESILRAPLQVSPYGEKIGISRSDRESPIKEQPMTLEDEQVDRIAESRHEHLETIEDESSICRYPEIGLKQCLKVQQSLPNGRSKESEDKRKDSSPIYAKWDQQQQIIVNEPARTFATFQSMSPCQSNVKANIRSRSPETKVSTVHEEVTQDPNKPTIILEDFNYENASRGDPDQLMIHSRENSNLSTATIPLDELESQRSSRFKTEEDPSRSRLQFGGKAQDRVVEETVKDTDERGAVINEVLVKNLQFEQDLPETPSEQTRSDRVVQQVNFRNILCDDYENEKLKSRKMYTKEEMDHQRLVDMLKKRDFKTLKMVSDKDITFNITLHFL
ncbi:hypothetical protein X777_09267 [Ooceraea biroi]|uniref:Uncharacterized protein n=1 Tax=Ooceraea biroi TaxID=2015173 RepID=A0A026W769_OOCBI|nr:hypothetical protein X777_09267 [Ooceraea biroi]